MHVSPLNGTLQALAVDWPLSRVILDNGPPRCQAFRSEPDVPPILVSGTHRPRAAGDRRPRILALIITGELRTLLQEQGLLDVLQFRRSIGVADTDTFVHVSRADTRTPGLEIPNGVYETKQQVASEVQLRRILDALGPVWHGVSDVPAAPQSSRRGFMPCADPSWCAAPTSRRKVCGARNNSSRATCYVPASGGCFSPLCMQCDLRPFWPQFGRLLEAYAWVRRQEQLQGARYEWMIRLRTDMRGSPARDLRPVSSWRGARSAVYARDRTIGLNHPGNAPRSPGSRSLPANVMVRDDFSVVSREHSDAFFTAGLSYLGCAQRRRTEAHCGGSRRKDWAYPECVLKLHLVACVGEEHLSPHLPWRVWDERVRFPRRGAGQRG